MVRPKLFVLDVSRVIVICDILVCVLHMPILQYVLTVINSRNRRLGPHLSKKTIECP